jgi:DNA excision repair protein ERCC-2
MDKAVVCSNTLGVKEFLAFLHPRGDIVTGFLDQNRSMVGIRYHKEWQKHLTGECEVPIRIELNTSRCFLTLIGRLDHLLVSEKTTLVQEFKTTETPEDQFGLMPVESDLEQLKCYAYMLMKQNNLTEVYAELLYRHIPKKAITTFAYVFSASELESFFKPLWEQYVRWHHAWLDWIQERNNRLQPLSFPFDHLRHGQSELIDQVEQHIAQSSVLWVEAPTGIGKTMGVLFPSVKQLVQAPFAKIFYLTAKTTQQENAVQAIERLRKNGAILRSVHIIAKEKCCPKSQKVCHPDYCEYAKGYYDRVSGALEALVQFPSFTSQEVSNLAAQYRLCPFEFSLDASLWADIIVGDYNYAFDPRVALKRYWENPEFQGILLVDEAHNLLDRAREMFSVEFNKKSVYALYKTLKQCDLNVAKAFRQLHKVFTQAENQEEVIENQYLVKVEVHKPLLEALELLTQSFNQAIQKKKITDTNASTLEFFWNAWFALKIFAWYQEDTYCTYFQKQKEDIRIKLFCIHPAQLIRKVLDKSFASVFFSATLTPLDFFRDSLGGSPDDTLLQIESPFSRSHQLVLTDTSLSTRWRDRDKSYEVIPSMIQRAVSAKKGNYLVYFPSYQYLKQVLQAWSHPSGIELIMQKEGMRDDEKTIFLNSFQEGRERTLVAFAVLGGFFSEGIDLVGERLSGVIIIGLGLPQVCLEREIIREYYQQVLQKGYAFAYLYPALNRVAQAGGRLIRSETDAGFILLVDDRYHHDSTQALLPPHWKPLGKVSQYQALPMILTNFWKNL